MQNGSSQLIALLNKEDWNSIGFANLGVFYLVAHQGHEYEKIILSIIDSTAALDKEGPSSLDEAQLQVDIYAKNMISVKAIGSKVREILDWHKDDLVSCVFQSEGESFSELTETKRLTQIYEVDLKI